MLNEKEPVRPSFLYDATVLHVVDAFSTASPLVPVRSTNPRKVWGVSSSSRIGTFRQPKCVQMDEGGEWKNETWNDLWAERRIKTLFRGAGARPWTLERRNGPAREMYSGLLAGDRYTGRQILSEAQWRLNTMI